MTDVVRILLIEDNRVVRRLVETIIEKTANFMIVGQTDSACQILELVATLKPNLVITDIGLPGMTGIEATCLIKSEYPDIRVLILTARSADALFFESFQAGADGYLLKDSFSQDKLKTAIDTVCLGRVWLDPLIARRVLDYDADAETLRKTANPKTKARSKALSSEERVVLNTLAADGEKAKEVTAELDKSFVKNLGRLCQDT